MVHITNVEIGEKGNLEKKKNGEINIEKLCFF